MPIERTASRGGTDCAPSHCTEQHRIDACENAFTNRIDTTLDQTGIYSVLVDVFFGGSGSYALAFERLIAPSSDAPSLTPGAYVTGEIDPVGDLDLYDFDGSAGDSVILTIAWNSGTMRPCLQLIDPDNSRSTACENAFSNQLDMKLPMTGTYAVLADVFFGGTGKYTLDFQCITGECPATVNMPIYLPIIRHD